MLIPIISPFGKTTKFVDFNGDSVQAIPANLSGITNTKVGTISLWIRWDTTPDTGVFGFGASTLPNQTMTRGSGTTSFTVVLGLANVGGTTILSVSHSFSSGTVYHIAISFDLTNSSNRHYYVNGSPGSPTWSTYTNDTINYAEALSSTGFYVGFAPNPAGFTEHTDLMQAVYINTDEYLDLSTNISKFINGGKPVDLGSNGSGPTGNQPAILLFNKAADFGTNLGYAGNFGGGSSLTDSAIPLAV